MPPGLAGLGGTRSIARRGASAGALGGALGMAAAARARQSRARRGPRRRVPWPAAPRTTRRVEGPDLRVEEDAGRRELVEEGLRALALLLLAARARPPRPRARAQRREPRDRVRGRRVRVRRARQQRRAAPCASLSGARQARRGGADEWNFGKGDFGRGASVGEAAWTDVGESGASWTGDCDTAGSGGGMEEGGGGGGSSSRGDTAGAASGSSFSCDSRAAAAPRAAAADGLRRRRRRPFLSSSSSSTGWGVSTDAPAAASSLRDASTGPRMRAQSRSRRSKSPAASFARTDDCVSTDSAKPCAAANPNTSRASSSEAVACGARRRAQAGPPPSSSARSARCNKAAGSSKLKRTLPVPWTIATASFRSSLSSRRTSELRTSAWRASSADDARSSASAATSSRRKAAARAARRSAPRGRALRVERRRDARHAALRGLVAVADRRADRVGAVQRRREVVEEVGDRVAVVRRRLVGRRREGQRAQLLARERHARALARARVLGALERGPPPAGVLNFGGLRGWGRRGAPSAAATAASALTSALRNALRGVPASTMGATSSLGCRGVPSASLSPWEACVTFGGDRGDARSALPRRLPAAGSSATARAAARPGSSRPGRWRAFPV